MNSRVKSQIVECVEMYEIKIRRCGMKIEEVEITLEDLDTMVEIARKTWLSVRGLG